MSIKPVFVQIPDTTFKNQTVPFGAASQVLKHQLVSLAGEMHFRLGE